jgi:putative hydrolase of the HAD superfamily
VGRLTRAVLLDALGTLLELAPPGPGLRRALGRRGIDVAPAAAERAMAAEISYYRAHLMAGADRQGVIALRRRCAETLAAALPDEVGGGLELAEVEAALLEALRFAPFGDVPGALAALNAQGVRLVVVSNWDRSLHDVLAATGLASQVHGVVTSAEAGAAKPAAAIFARALSVARAPASAALHVGDRWEEDVVGARAAGIRPVLLVRDGRSPPAADGVRVIRSLGELPAAGS